MQRRLLLHCAASTGDKLRVNTPAGLGKPSRWAANEPLEPCKNRPALPPGLLRRGVDGPEDPGDVRDEVAEEKPERDAPELRSQGLEGCVDALAAGNADAVTAGVRGEVEGLCARFPVYRALAKAA